MDPVSLVTEGLTAMGYGTAVPVVFAVVGLFSVVSTVYPSSWKGAGTVHKLALLLGNAKPASPAVTPVQVQKVIV